MNVIYTGIFFDEDTYNQLKAQSNTQLLDKRIENPHVTLEFKPKQLLPEELIGREVEVTIVGEGNDGMNHGYLITLPEEVEEYYRGATLAHITMSIDRTAKPVNTKDVDFETRHSFTVKGKVGYFTSEGVIC